jgi:hypothetical protein
VLALAAPVLKLAGLDGTLCPSQTNGQLNCVSVPGRVTGLFVGFTVFVIVAVIFSLVCQVKIITKAGYSGWYVLTGFVPILGFVMFLIFAFGKWPIQERLERAERGMGPGYPPSPPYSPPYSGMPGSGGGGPPAYGGPGPGSAGGAGAPPFGPPPPALVQQPGSGGLPASGDPHVIYCSWCGKGRAVNAQAIHHCGSMDRPAAFCMGCGAPLDGASSCVSCGTPSSKVSR